MKTKLDHQILELMSKDPQNWKGPIYYNPKDPRLLVPKINPYFGWTFNFASPYSYVTLGAIIVIAIVATLIIK